MKTLRMVWIGLALMYGAGNSYASEMSENPLLKESTLQYEFPHFDRIKEEHFVPAMEAGMAEQLKEIEAIANNRATATFENTLVAMERSGKTLDRAQRVFSGLNGTHTNPKLQAIEKEMAPKLAAHADAIRLNPALFKRIQALYEERERLAFDPEAKRLIERYHLDFVRAGAKLAEKDKDRLKAINSELASLRPAFSQNVLKEVNASAVLVERREELEGLSENAIASAAAAAKEAGHEGKYLVILMNTTGQPPLKELKNRALREKIHKASINRNSQDGEFDTRENLAKIAKLRAERAKLLGYENHAAFELEDQTARTVKTVNDLLRQLAPAAVSNARREAAELQKIIEAEKGGFELTAWDWAYYAEKARKARYAFEESQIRPYFEMNRVLVDGIFFAATKLYGITFKERKDLPLYHPDTTTWEVFNEDGSPLALLIIDWYARPSKRGGAWANSYVSQSYVEGTKPVVGNHLNIPKPAEG
ncbi:MAG TPA: M3 family metallopeptidase, partial [Candidatus Kapabacteria bacterium]|nr:M3 family metallopeptidase [Candidatus Kapabacteria bacterium]